MVVILNSHNAESTQHRSHGYLHISGSTYDGKPIISRAQRAEQALSSAQRSALENAFLAERFAFSTLRSTDYGILS